jgi:hypothetical protein
MSGELELAACTPLPLRPGGFNPRAILPHGLTTAHVQAAMNDFVNFLGFINLQLHTRGIERLETMLMPANFSSIVGEFMSSSIPKHCPTIVKNQYHNGHPDMIPKGRFPNDAVQHASEGIEIKGSRYVKRWQGHNPEDTWLMVFVFDSNRPVDAAKGIAPRPFRFVMVAGARLAKEDWLFAGRSETSRRTITASVTESGYEKMMGNWIYKAADLSRTGRERLEAVPPPSELG